jgi:hypothetical protein
MINFRVLNSHNSHQALSAVALTNKNSQKGSVFETGFHQTSALFRLECELPFSLANFVFTLKNCLKNGVCCMMRLADAVGRPLFKTKQLMQE